jgi:type I protein arginine methyltransferase
LLNEHHNYLSDPIRMRQWMAALAAGMPPGATVVDLGAGTGILGLLALRAGASRVYSIEYGPIAGIAEAIARENQLDDRVTVLRGMSTRIELPEPVDVLIADQIGYFGFNAGAFTYFADACHRFLKPGGRTFPHSITLQCAPVESQVNFDRVDFWRQSPAGFSMESAWRQAVNTPVSASRVAADALLGAPVCSAPLPLNPPAAAMVRLAGDVEVTRDGTLHGLAGFFSAELFPGVKMTNSPFSSEAISRAVSFLPIERPVPVRRGDSIAITVLVRPVEMVVSWIVRVHGHRFHYSSFETIPLASIRSV